MTANLVLRQLAKGEFEIMSEVAKTPEEFRHQIKTNRPELILADYNLGAVERHRRPRNHAVQKVWISP